MIRFKNFVFVACLALPVSVVAGDIPPLVLETCLRAANGYVAEHYPQYDLRAGSVSVSRQPGVDRVLDVTYELPPGFLGGAPLVRVDERTLKIVGATMGQ